MSWSLARDLDLRYERGDLERVRAEYPGGPQGLFLKRASGGLTIDRAAGFPWLRRVRPDEGRLYYAKAFAYPLLAAPFVAVLGTRGLLVANALAALARAVARLRESCAGGASETWPALAVAASLLLLTVAPVYLIWTTPELLGLALVTGGLAAWASGRPLLAAVLFGVAGYLKPPNLLMAAPLGLEPLLPPPGALGLGPDLARRLGESLQRGLVLVAAAGSLYAANAALTGELNYQGGERKTFYQRFPLDAGGATFDDSGFWMTTNQLGPLVSGRDDANVTRAQRPGAPALRVPRGVPPEPRLLLVRPLRRSARVLLPGPARAAAVPRCAGRATAPAGSRSPRSCCRGSPTSGSSRTTGTAAAGPSGTATS